MCPDPGRVKNARRQLNGNNPLETVVYTCNRGFPRASGDLIRICQVNGAWSGDGLVCRTYQYMYVCMCLYMTRGAGVTDLSGAPEFIPGFPQFSAMYFVDHCLSHCSYSCGHCIVSTTIYCFQLPFWYVKNFLCAIFRGLWIFKTVD